MNGGDDKGGKPPGPGGVQHDDRGNAVWQWAVDTGKHALDSTSRLLKRLEVPGLEIAKDDKAAPATKAAHKDATPKVNAQAGYDPYGGASNSARGSGGGHGAGSAQRAGSAQGAGGTARKPGVSPASRPEAVVRKPAAAPEARPSLWNRLFRKD